MQHQPQPPSRPSIWPWLAALGCLLPGFLCLGFIFLVSFAPSPPSEPDSSILKIHRTDVRTWDPAGTPLIIRCGVCGGSGRAPRFQHSGDGSNPSAYRFEQWIRCPMCGGSGWAEARHWSWKIVPDGVPDTYPTWDF